MRQEDRLYLGKIDSWGVEVTSGDGEENAGCKLILMGFGQYVAIRMPAIIRPNAEKVSPKWDAATVARLGRDYYWNYTERRYGICFSEGGFVNVHYGRCTDDSSTEQRAGYFLPWMQWRHVRFSLYDRDGQHFWTQRTVDRRLGQFDEQNTMEKLCPGVAFGFRDFDGEYIEANTHIDEREWWRGEKWCKWMAAFWPKKVVRSLSINFDKETGRRKGSWKGGTLGCGINMEPGELHRSAFQRYCQENGMTFVAEVPWPVADWTRKVYPQADGAKQEAAQA